MKAMVSPHQATDRRWPVRSPSLLEKHLANADIGLESRIAKRERECFLCKRSPGTATNRGEIRQLPDWEIASDEFLSRSSEATKQWGEKKCRNGAAGNRMGSHKYQM